MKRLVPLALVVTAGLAGACSSSTKSNTSSTTASTTPPTTVATPSTSNPSTAQTLNESGSSLLFPFLQQLVTPLKTQFSNVTLAASAGGSGKGISDAIAGVTQMGGSDAYLSNSQLTTNPGLLNIPIAVSSQAVNYNLPGVKDLKLTGDVLAKVYQGSITKWNDQAIASLNPGVTLPATTIVPVRRVDSSGDTFLFTSFLSATNATWKNGPAFGTTVTWPAAPGELTASGNPGMVQTCKATPGCVAYIGISAEATAQTAGLGEALLQNQAGNYLQPNTSTVNAAVTAGASNVPDNLAASLIYEPGAQSYPIVNFEYIIVKNKQATADLATAIRDFLVFAIDPNGGSTPTFLAKDQFVALPSSVLPKVNAAIASISS
ncbi:MAG TPA: phosphate ABC transporter substrate-binding protein PstS [Acidimicrobiales bacterium]